jgi:hypothetical protein
MGFVRLSRRFAASLAELLSSPDIFPIVFFILSLKFPLNATIKQFLYSPAVSYLSHFILL